MAEVLYDLIQIQNLYAYALIIFLIRFLMYKNRALDLYEDYLTWKIGRSVATPGLYFSEKNIKEGFFTDIPKYVEVLNNFSRNRYAPGILDLGIIFFASLVMVFLPLFICILFVYLAFYAESKLLLSLAIMLISLGCVVFSLKRYTDVITFKQTLGK